jgi:hypothetical protein
MRYAQALKQVYVREGERELSDEAALTLCSAWQSSGSIGWTLAAVATGAWSPESLHDGSLAVISGQPVGERGETFRSDLWRTFEDSASGSTEMLVWSMLGTWSLNGGDNS